MANGDFKEIARIKTTDTTDLVLSEINKSGEVSGFAINPFITSEKYTGFGKGIGIPADELINFLAMFSTDDLKAAIEQKQ